MRQAKYGECHKNPLNSFLNTLWECLAMDCPPRHVLELRQRSCTKKALIFMQFTSMSLVPLFLYSSSQWTSRSTQKISKTEPKKKKKNYLANISLNRIDFKRVISAIFFHDRNNLFWYWKLNINIKMPRSAHITRNKYLSMDFFPLMPSENESPGWKLIFWTDGSLLIPVTSKSIQCVCHALLFICGLWRQVTICIATCACLFPETDQHSRLGKC